MTAVIWCQACRQPAEPGELLRVVPVDGSPEFAIHRARVSASCLRAAGTVADCRIAEYDRDAAIAFDHQLAGTSVFDEAEASARRAHETARR